MPERVVDPYSSSAALVIDFGIKPFSFFIEIGEDGYFFMFLQFFNDLVEWLGVENKDIGQAEILQGFAVFSAFDDDGDLTVVEFFQLGFNLLGEHSVVRPKWASSDGTIFRVGEGS